MTDGTGDSSSPAPRNLTVDGMIPSDEQELGICRIKSTAMISVATEHQIICFIMLVVLLHLATAGSGLDKSKVSNP